MVASLYICDKSFLYNETDSDIDVVKKIDNFCDLVQRVQSTEFSEDNILFLDKRNFYTTEIFSKLTITECLDVDKRPAAFRDVINRLWASLQKCKNFRNSSTESLIEFITLEDADTSCAILVLNKQDDLPQNKQIFSNIDGWINFRLSHLIKYPHNASYFLKEAKCLFPNVIINPETEAYMGEIYDHQINHIIKCLSYLNNKILGEYKNFQGDDFAFMKAPKPDMMEGSFEGSKKKEFNVSFKYNNKTIKLYCEPHLKYNTDDQGRKRKVMRVYFQMPKENDERIYVGYIRKHI